MNPARTPALASLVLAAAALTTAPAWAANVDQCVDANTQAQVLRRDKKLAAAREQLKVCSDPACPEVVRADCTQRVEEINGAQPTVVIDAKDGAGADLVAVKVTVDGTLLVDKLDGSALPVDPGPRSFTFEVAGQPAVTRVIVVKEGEKARRERVVFGPASAQPDPTAGQGARTRRTLGLALGGVGVAGLAVGTAFGVLAMSRWSRAKTECSSMACPDHAAAVSDHDATVTFGNVSTASLAVGGALVVSGVVLFVTGRRDAARPVTGLTPLVGPGLAGLSAAGSF